jgi:hypothetical protein
MLPRVLRSCAAVGPIQRVVAVAAVMEAGSTTVRAHAALWSSSALSRRRTLPSARIACALRARPRHPFFCVFDSRAVASGDCKLTLALPYRSLFALRPLVRRAGQRHCWTEAVWRACLDHSGTSPCRPCHGCRHCSCALSRGHSSGCVGKRCTGFDRRGVAQLDAVQPPPWWCQHTSRGCANYLHRRFCRIRCLLASSACVDADNIPSFFRGQQKRHRHCTGCVGHRKLRRQQRPRGHDSNCR